VKLEVWEKDFPAGWVGLGVNAVDSSGTHYLALVKNRSGSEDPFITDLYPGQLRTARLEPNVKMHADRDDKLEVVPEELRGRTLIQTLNSRRSDAKLRNIFTFTKHPSSETPDQVVLTWSHDPRTTQTIQWRTNRRVTRGAIRYYKKPSAPDAGKPRPEVMEVSAETERLESKFLLNDPIIHRHTGLLLGLEPDTTYYYWVGDPASKRWSQRGEFTTAPDKVKPFSFIYMGDAQNGLDTWGKLVRGAHYRQPNAAFYIMAGDLVDRGNERDDWDSLFANAKGVYDHRQLVPVIGNHECQGGHPTLYLKLFGLMQNGPANVERERAYAFEYSNALFVVLDSNLDPVTQTAWLEEQLARSKAKWKFVTYHHPAYSSLPKRDNVKLRELWTPLFDKYHVDMALQGHDHAYLRTYPMKGQKQVGSPAEGTVYIVSVSGTKLYEQDKRDYTEFGMTNVATYQVLDIQIEGDRLIYRAYDTDGKLRDELIIDKSGR